MSEKNGISPSVLTFLGTVITAAFLYLGTQGAGNVSQRSSEFERIKHLEETSMEQQGEIAAYRAEIAMLEAQVRFDLGLTPLEAITHFIEDFPIPAWIKRWVPETQEFVMEGINIPYAQFYCVTRARYKDSTDFDIYPEELAQTYYDNDLAVLLARGKDQVQESVRRCDGEVVDLEFYKFYVDLPDGSEFVAGVQVER